MPFELIRLASLNGVGPMTLKTLHRELGISNREVLLKALQDGSILKLKGFGQKRVNKLLSGLGVRNKTEERVSLKEALSISKAIVKEMKKCKEVKQIEVAGSIRRHKETIGDIDVLVSCIKADRLKIIEHFIHMNRVKEVQVKGETKVSVRIKDRDRQVDLRLVDEDEWGAAMVYFTGSKQHNIYLRTLAKARGLKINEYGVFKGSKKIAGKTEEDVYESLGMKWIKPEKRKDVTQ